MNLYGVLTVLTDSPKTNATDSSRVHLSHGAFLKKTGGKKMSVLCGFPGEDGIDYEKMIFSENKEVCVNLQKVHN